MCIFNECCLYQYLHIFSFKISNSYNGYTVAHTAPTMLFLLDNDSDLQFQISEISFWLKTTTQVES